MSHYDNCRPGYCAKCGAAPGNIVNGVCGICHPPKKKRKPEVTDRDMNLLNSCSNWLATRSEMHSFRNSSGLMKEYAESLANLRERLHEYAVEKPVTLDEIFGKAKYTDYPVVLDGSPGFGTLRVPSGTPIEKVKEMLARLSKPKATFHR